MGESDLQSPGLCHVIYFKPQFTSLILPCEKQKFARSILHDFYFLGVIRDDLFYLLFLELNFEPSDVAASGSFHHFPVISIKFRPLKFTSRGDKWTFTNDCENTYSISWLEYIVRTGWS